MKRLIRVKQYAARLTETLQRNSIPVTASVQEKIQLLKQLAQPSAASGSKAPSEVQQPPSTPEKDITVERKREEEELDALLFGPLDRTGRSATKRKLSPQGEASQGNVSIIVVCLAFYLSKCTILTPADTKDQVPVESPSKVVRHLSTQVPGLAIGAYKTTPSHQRDLLEIARDLAKLERSIDAGEKPKDVANIISFTK